MGEGGSMLRLRTAEGVEICSELRPAHTHWTRMKGLLGSKNLPDGSGLWIKPCQQVHMYFMRYPIDLIFLDDDLRVVRLIENQAVNTISEKVPEAASVVEVPVGTIAGAGLREGAVLVVDGASKEMLQRANVRLSLRVATIVVVVVLMVVLYRIVAA